MPFTRLSRLSACLALGACLAGAQALSFEPVTTSEMEASPLPEPLPASWLDRLLRNPLTSWLLPPAAELGLVELLPPSPPCMIDPLNELADPEALAFENGTAPGGTVNLTGLLPGAHRALSRFESMVERVGGRLLLTSAYRPAAYQAHLQDVWDKWMIDLRYNTAPECADLRAAAAGEFARHQLLESQRPVSFSDHTRGIGFDAAVLLPRNARLGRKRVGIDTLARVAGFRRPAIASDPVHFRFVAGI